MKIRHVAILLLFAFPSPALAAEPSIVVRDLPVQSSRSLVSAAPTFNLVGLHWQGAGTVEFRARSLAGRWSPWRPAAPEVEDRPDAAAAERTVPGWRVGNPWWTGASDALQVRTRGTVRRVRAHYVWSPADERPTRTLSLAGWPAIISRPSWGANESIRRAAPSYASELRFAVVHHTAGTNSYTRTQSAAIVRGIQTYHVQGNGWNDVGYNFLVDKYGQVFEGRYGGADRPVVGAHAEGFNTGSVGVALIGTYSATGATQAAYDALVRLLAWRLDVAHVDPLSTFNWTSRGNGRFPSGLPVFLRTISGHRDTGYTSCPGDVVYRQLNDIAGQVSATGLPKLYFPALRGRLGGPVRATARLSIALPWTVRITDALGNQVAAGSGLGTSVDWTWDATAAPVGAYAWSIEAPGVLPAAGTIGGGPAATLALTRVRVEPGIVTPNADGREDATTISYVLSVPATVTATLIDPNGVALATLFSEARPAGEQSFLFSAESVADGAYRIQLTASAGGKQAAASMRLVVNRTLGFVQAGREVFSPNRDGRVDALPVKFFLATPADVKLRILKAGRWVATPFAGPLTAGPQTLSYDGAKRVGRLLDGEYEAEVAATTLLGTVAHRIEFRSDTRSPQLRLVSLSPLRIWVSEPSRVVVWSDAQRFQLDAHGRARVPAPAAPRKVKALAWDEAGNVSRAARYP
jgi:hypothetical protein